MGGCSSKPKTLEYEDKPQDLLLDPKKEPPTSDFSLVAPPIIEQGVAKDENAREIAGPQQLPQPAIAPPVAKQEEVLASNKESPAVKEDRPTEPAAPEKDALMPPAAEEMVAAGDDDSPASEMVGSNIGSERTNDGAHGPAKEEACAEVPLGHDRPLVQDHSLTPGLGEVSAEKVAYDHGVAGQSAEDSFGGFPHEGESRTVSESVTPGDKDINPSITPTVVTEEKCGEVADQSMEEVESSTLDNDTVETKEVSTQSIVDFDSKTDPNEITTVIAQETDGPTTAESMLEKRVDIPTPAPEESTFTTPTESTTRADTKSDSNLAGELDPMSESNGILPSVENGLCTTSAQDGFEELPKNIQTGDSQNNPMDLTELDVASTAAHVEVLQDGQEHEVNGIDVQQSTPESTERVLMTVAIEDSEPIHEAKTIALMEPIPVKETAIKEHTSHDIDQVLEKLASEFERQESLSNSRS